MSLTAGLANNRIDWTLMLLVGALLSAGLVMLTSASMSVADSATGRPFFYLEQQLLAVAAGLLMGFVMLQVPTEVWERLAPFLLMLSIALLALVLVPGIGREANGARRWLPVAGVNLQVSEPARLMVLMYISGYAVRHRDELRAGFFEFSRPMILVLAVCGLLLVEPDFGATVVVLLIAMSVLFVAGAPLRYFLALSGVVAAYARRACRLGSLSTCPSDWLHRSVERSLR